MTSGGSPRKASSSLPDGLVRLVRFGGALRDQGVSVGVDDVADLCQAVMIAPEDLYWAGRVTLLSGHEQLGTYDRVFAEHFLGLDVGPPPTAEDPSSEDSPDALATPRHASESGPSGEVSLASTLDVLRNKS